MHSYKITLKHQQQQCQVSLSIAIKKVFSCLKFALRRVVVLGLGSPMAILVPLRPCQMVPMRQMDCESVIGCIQLFLQPASWVWWMSKGVWTENFEMGSYLVLFQAVFRVWLVHGRRSGKWYRKIEQVHFPFSLYFLWID